MAKTSPILARVLQAISGLGVACNEILQGPPETINALSAAGFVDVDAGAVAYAQAQGARVVVLADIDGAGEIAAAALDAPVAAL